MECNERDDTPVRRSIKVDTPEKVPSEEFVSGETHTECPESDSKRKSRGRGSSQNSTHTANEPEETPAISEQKMLESLRNCDISPDIVMHSPVVGSSETNEKENMDEASQVMEVDTFTAEASSISNQTFDKRLFFARV